MVRHVLVFQYGPEDSGRDVHHLYESPMTNAFEAAMIGVSPTKLSGHPFLVSFMDTEFAPWVQFHFDPWDASMPPHALFHRLLLELRDRYKNAVAHSISRPVESGWVSIQFKGEPSRRIAMPLPRFEREMVL